MELTVYLGSRGFFIAPPGLGVEHAEVQRVSPYYAARHRAWRACTEKEAEYNAANGPKLWACDDISVER